MIRVVLSGGTGNQLFQYAAGRALALKLGTDLIVDRPTSKLTSVKRVYAMPRFNVVTKEANLLSSLYRKWALKSHRSFLVKGKIFYQEECHFNENFFDLPDETTLFGFFQNERFFKPFSDFIRKELTFQEYPLAEDTIRIIDKIQTSNSVAVHVRRGDAYLNSDKFNVCTLSYYESAIELFRQKLDTPKFFFFSDDIDWCVKNFKDRDYNFCALQQSKEDSLNDLNLMSLCQNNIIANSTFSWWGAWLNPNPTKLVAAPNVWFHSAEDPVNEIVCDEWIKVNLN